MVAVMALVIGLSVGFCAGCAWATLRIKIF